MADDDLEQQEPFPVEMDERQPGDEEEQPDGVLEMGCFEKFHRLVSKWMLPEHLREKYLERANCFPPPIFIILISIAEVVLHMHDTDTVQALGQWFWFTLVLNTFRVTVNSTVLLFFCS